MGRPHSEENWQPLGQKSFRMETALRQTKHRTSTHGVETDDHMKAAGRYYFISYEDDFAEDNVPIITVEVLDDSDDAEEQNMQIKEEPAQNTTKNIEEHHTQDNYTIENETGESELSKNDDDSKFKREVEYMTRENGTVICKLCGEVLQSRTHWYRHKYRVHVIQPWHTTPLFKCEICRIYFKSRKGYLGHIASKHSELHADSQPVLFNAQVKFTPNQNNDDPHEDVNSKDPELAIPKSTVPTSNAVSVIRNKTKNKSQELKKLYRNSNSSSFSSFCDSWEEERSREEKLVADIIDRVKRECEAQGAGGPARRGYSRKPTIMNNECS